MKMMTDYGKCVISGSQGSEYEDDSLLGYTSTSTRLQGTIFQKAVTFIYEMIIMFT
jgi:hypothetical protein